jgi:mannose PTS system EIIC component
VVDRPLFWGMVWAALSGQTELALGTAIFLELFWLDFFPAGTFIPPHGLLSLALVLTTAALLDVTGPQGVALIITAALPMAWAGSRLERFQRALQDSSYNALVHSTRNSTGRLPMTLVQGSIVQIAALSFLLFAAAQLIFYWVFRFLFATFGETIGTIPISWPHLWVLATLGPLLSLRHRLPYLYFLGALGVTGIVLWLLTLAGPDVIGLPKGFP